jgi:ribosomal-protein-alanine N-acetyltransferase
MRRPARARRRLSAFERVETERLLLRRPVLEDAGVHHGVHADPRTWEHRPELRHRTPAESERQLVHWLGHWLEHGYGYWTVERDGRAIGFGGLMLLPAWRGGEDVLNLYYRFEPQAWGRGYATETARAALELAARELPGPLVVARIRPNNDSSVRVAERAGMVRRADLDDAEFLVYGSS